MDELDKAQGIAVTGDVRARALETFARQLAAWGVAMPPAEPVVLDFGLGEFETVGLVECWIANEVAAGYCGKHLFVTDGQTCPMHHHAQKHETFFVLEGAVKVIHDGRERVLEKGDVLRVAPGTKHGFTGRGAALLLELSQPCIIADNAFEDERIPMGR